MNVSGISKTVLLSFRDNKRPVTFGGLVKAVMEHKMNVSGISKTVLLSFRDNKRPVTFISDNRVTETDSLICAFKETFADVLGDESIHEVLLQIKDEDWEGNLWTFREYQCLIEL